MEVTKIYHRGTEINKIQFSEIEYLLEEKNIDVMDAFEQMADSKEFVYISNGFLTGLNADEADFNEWHHFFKKDADGNFEADKFYFN